MKRFSLSLLCLFIGLYSQAQHAAVKVSSYLPKDTARYEQATDLRYNYGDGEYGQTELILHCESEQGHFEFVFNKKVLRLTRIISYKQGAAVSETYHIPSGKWKVDKDSHQHAEMKSAATDTVVYSEHHLYAFVLLQDHGGTVEKAKFKDFGNVVYWPEFDYTLCSVSDEDKDGNPEFYLTYYGESDGLDAKELKQIIYTIPAVAAKGSNFIKSKATAYYPSGNPEDVYHVEYDSSWRSLPKAVQQKSIHILKQHQRKYTSAN